MCSWKYWYVYTPSFYVIQLDFLNNARFVINTVNAMFFFLKWMAIFAFSLISFCFIIISATRNDCSFIHIVLSSFRHKSCIMAGNLFRSSSIAYLSLIYPIKCRHWLQQRKLLIVLNLSIVCMRIFCLLGILTVSIWA